MADKGFLIQDLLADVGAKLIIPPFKQSAQFSKEETANPSHCPPQNNSGESDR